jgi:hypothetical protein
MLDLKHLPTSASARIARLAPRRDAGGAIVWDLDFACDIVSDDDAKIVDAYVPGAIEQYDAGQRHSASGTAKVSGGFNVVRVSFRDIDGETLANGHADVRAAAVNVKGESAVLVVKVRIHGLLPHAAAALAYSLDECVDVSIQSQQHSSSRAPAQVPRDDLTGCIVVVDGIAGMVVESDADGVTLDTLNESLHVETSAVLSTTLDVSPPDGWTHETIITKYRERAIESGREPTWEAMIEAIGNLYASGEVEASADCSWPITDAVLDRAISLCESIAEA